MAVPKKKTSPSRRGMRRSHNALDKIQANVVIDKKTGELGRFHHIASDGTYRGRQIIVHKNKESKE